MKKDPDHPNDQTKFFMKRSYTKGALGASGITSETQRLSPTATELPFIHRFSLSIEMSSTRALFPYPYS
jgi:hypothetical protein